MVEIKTIFGATNAQQAPTGDVQDGREMVTRRS